MSFLDLGGVARGEELQHFDVGRAAVAQDGKSKRKRSVASL